MDQQQDMAPVNQQADMAPVNQQADMAPVNQQEDMAPVNQQQDMAHVNQQADMPHLDQQEDAAEVVEIKPAVGAHQSLVDPSLELTDPTPDIRELFQQFNDRFFWGRLAGVEVKWSYKMTQSAGNCSYTRNSGFCIRLSEPLLKLRPRKDLVETLLHEMIHAYLLATQTYVRRAPRHGRDFLEHAERINRQAGTSISVFHHFIDEADFHCQHWYRCGTCRRWLPCMAHRRHKHCPPQPRAEIYHLHREVCAGTFRKVRRPELYASSVSKVLHWPYVPDDPERGETALEVAALLRGLPVEVETGVRHLAIKAEPGDSDRAMEAEAGVGDRAMEAEAGVGDRAMEVEAGVSDRAMEAEAGVGDRAMEAEAGVGDRAMEAEAGVGDRAMEAEAGVGDRAMEAEAGVADRAMEAEAGVGDRAIEAAIQMRDQATQTMLIFSNPETLLYLVYQWPSNSAA